MSNSNNRNIYDILCFRSDISPFLTHLTKNDNYSNAKDKITKILNDKYLEKGFTAISSMKFANGCDKDDEQTRKEYLSAISFTETPLNEIHAVIDISYKGVDLQPYGIMFIKEKMINKGVNPVLYLNTYYEKGKTKSLIDALWKLKESSPEEAKTLFPLIATFGEQFFYQKSEDFIWEREWRYASEPKLCFDVENDVFIGLCPHDEIKNFEKDFSPIAFVDPRRNMKMYARKLVDLGNRIGSKYSIV